MTAMRAPAVLALAIAAALTACDTPVAPPPVSAGAAPVAQTSMPNSEEQSVTYQLNAQHTGYAHGPLRAPLKELWSDKIGGYNGNVPYPVIANGIVVVTANAKLIALDEKTGKKLWAQNALKDNNWVGPAYDDGMIFVSSFTTNGPRNIGMYAFDERTGKKLWSARTPGQSEFSSPPTAASGTVYTAAAGDGGTMYAYDEATGALKWTAPVENGDDSSPAVTSSGVYVSYACPQTYDLGPSNGQVIWHYSGPCEGGGGSTPVLYDGLLFVEDSQVSSTYDGLILNATNGAAAGRFNAEFPPAFTLQLGFFVSPKTLVARTIPKMKRVWSVRLSGHDKYNAPPLVVGNVVYTTTIANTLIGYDVGTGKQKILQKMVNSTNFNDAIAGLGFGDGELVVPDGPYLIAFGGS